MSESVSESLSARRGSAAVVSRRGSGPEMRSAAQLTHSLTHSLTRSLTHSLTHSSHTPSPSPSLITHSLTHHTLTHSLTHSCGSARVARARAALKRAYGKTRTVIITCIHFFSIIVPRKLCLISITCLTI